ncbi:hypothetical protein [Treponema endosymbiont of Eucomonympha sp.]|uniref:hypothetical protein n=2 Tax=Treponema endosymbiont of Eucomonympha sp. TaxID=1580831 RepID=UPI000751543D|nr:hypothetical protein [Treponema endosymbiont of Eucomonympha sp.]
MGHDYVPGGDAPFWAWAKQLVGYAETRLADFGIPDETFAAIKGLYAAFDAAYQKAASPNHGKVDVLEKDEARAALEKAPRPFAKTYLMFNPAVSDSDRENMGLSLHNKKPTPVPPPSTYPDWVFDTKTIRRISLRFRDQGSTSRAKPPGVHGAEIRWGFSAAPPAGVDDLTASEFCTNSPHTLVFAESERGKTVYFCLRWENTTGEKGGRGARF